MKKTVFDDRDRTAEVAVYVTRINQLRVLEHQEAALNSQIKFLEGAEHRLAGARARKQAVLDEILHAKMRVDLAKQDVPASILRTIEGAADELGQQAEVAAKKEDLASRLVAPTVTDTPSPEASAEDHGTAAALPTTASEGPGSGGSLLG